MNEPVSLDEAQENGNQMSYENQVPIMEEVFGLGLTQDEVDDKALEALHFIAGKWNVANETAIYGNVASMRTSHQKTRQGTGHEKNER